MPRLLRSASPMLPSYALLLALLVAAGCSRRQYHQAADTEVYHLIHEKSDDPRWAAPGFQVEMHPSSRYFEPYNQDKPPMPPDDPASHRLMHYVDHKKHWKHWHRNGDRPDLENPWWYQQLGCVAEVTPEGEVKLTLEKSLELAYLHSPDYQEEIEDVYLSALDVSTERFRFDVQFLQSFSGNDTSFTHLGRRRSPAGESNALQSDTDLQLQRQFATAAELLVGFANSTIWQFAGPDTYTTTSILNFSLVQPLLRRGGKPVALEQLTIVERTLLANLRAFQRYRTGFYTDVAIGDLGVVGPQRRGGFFGGTGLTGFTGQGAGGLGGVGQATGFGRSGFGGGGIGGGGAATGFAGGGAGQVGGFIGLLQAQQQIQNTRESYDSQLAILRQLEDLLDAGIIEVVQVDQFRQNIETERANLLLAEVELQNAIDNFLTGTLGLPPCVRVQLDDSLIEQFQFIAPELSALQDRVSDLQQAIGELGERLEPGATTPEGEPAKPLTRNDVAEKVVEAEIMGEAVDKAAGLVGRDFKQWAARLGAGRGARPARTPTRGVKTLQDELDRERESFEGATDRLAKSRQALADLRGELANPATKHTLDELLATLVIETRSIFQVLLDLSLIQARARVETIEEVEEFKLDPCTALQIARSNRLDWMNNRAALVDTWRLIEFNANALKSDLDITFSGDIQTLGDKPFRFRAPTGTLRAGLRFDGPFNRLLERNNYRQSLIDYQRDRRQLIQFEDGIHQSLRSLLRRLEQLRQNLEIQRRAVAISIRRVDQTLAKLDEPPAPGAPPQLSDTVVLDIITALSDLRNTQNNFMSVWLNHYATRMVLERELGTMQLDGCGRWLDPEEGDPLEDGKTASPTPEELPIPPELPMAWVVDAGLAPGEANAPKHR